jgi:hypothetical protein
MCKLKWLHPLSAEGEKRVDQQSAVGVNNYKKRLITITKLTDLRSFRFPDYKIKNEQIIRDNNPWSVKKD